ncbi:MAG: sialidase [Planctomycetia bacterium]|nr:sialidase [Planctomycetia bacterium]
MKWYVTFFGMLISVVLVRAAESLIITTSIPAQPALIRNDKNSLARVVVDMPPGQTDLLQVIHFSIDGSTELESLTLQAGDDIGAFKPKIIGNIQNNIKQSVSIRCDAKLQSGKNVFWLKGKLKPAANLLKTISAKCTLVETKMGRISANDLSPSVRQRIGIALRKHMDDGVHTYRIPALTTTTKGTLLCVYDMRRRKSRDLQEDIDIGLSRSTDGGATWEPQRVIMDMGKYGGLPEEQNGCSDPGIIVDQRTGDIFCFAVWMNGKPGKHQWNADGSEPGFEIGKSAQFMMVRSKDDGRTWTKPENLTSQLKKEAWWLFAPSPQHGINLKDGTLVMPSQGRDEKGREFSTIMTSTNRGASWIIGQPAIIGSSECQAVELEDGSIMLNMRNEKDRAKEQDRLRLVYVTKDRGKTWFPHESNRKSLIEPRCNGSLIRVDYQEAGKKKHVLLFANPHSQKGRTHQTIQISFDEGKTWPKSHHLLLDEGRGAGYASLTRVDEDHIGIVYEGSQAHLVFEKIPLRELLYPKSNHTVKDK